MEDSTDRSSMTLEDPVVRDRTFSFSSTSDGSGISVLLPMLVEEVNDKDEAQEAWDYFDDVGLRESGLIPSILHAPYNPALYSPVPLGTGFKHPSIPSIFEGDTEDKNAFGMPGLLNLMGAEEVENKEPYNGLWPDSHALVAILEQLEEEMAGLEDLPLLPSLSPILIVSE